MGSPLLIVFADGSCRCVTCKGFGLVRGAGERAGSHYRTLKGAQEALDNGRAVDCDQCEGTGIVESGRSPLPQAEDVTGVVDSERVAA